MDRSNDLNTFINSSPSNLDQFEQFLIQEGLKHQLEFVWAVQGLKSESLHLGQIIRTIYKHYFHVLHVSESVKADVKCKVSTRDYSLDIFDKAVDEVWQFLDSVVYKEFLNHAQALELVSSSSVPFPTDQVPAAVEPAPTTCGPGVTGIAAAPSNNSTTDGVLPSTSQTVVSDPVPILVDRGPSLLLLSTSASSSSIAGAAGAPLAQTPPSASASPNTAAPPSLLQYPPNSSSSVPKIPSSSLEPLIEGQELRNQASSGGRTIVKLSTEALIATQKSRSGIEQMPHSLSKQKPKFPYHYANYNSYNPVSRQDSEVQSFSSGCLTDSDSVIESRNKSRHRRDHERRDIHVEQDNLPNFYNQQPRNFPVVRKNQTPEEFAAELTMRLQELKRSRESEEKMRSHFPDELAQAIREKCHVDDTQPDDILDKHVSRVWSDVTPDSSRSPPGRREYKKVRPTANTALRSRVYTKDQEHQLPKSKTFPSTAKYDQDSGISITTTSTNDEFITTWLNNSKPSTKSSNSAKAKCKKEISSCVTYPENTLPYSFKIQYASTVTLGIFKENLPKKGNYRYFFKYVGAEEGLGTVWEEITKDDAVLPLYEGKIVAHLRDV